MRLLDKLERRFGRYAIPNVTLILIFPQVAFYAISYAQPAIINVMTLIPSLVLAGQWWRVITFLLIPPFSGAVFTFFNNPIMALFYWYLFYLMESALEDHWGSFRYNIFLLIGFVATVAVSFLVPDQPTYNGFLQGSVFLAFAFLFPDFVIYIFFILPVKIKWLALLTWISYAFTMIFGDLLAKLLVLASVCNFLLFFASDIRDRIKTGRRHMAFQASQMGGRHDEKQPFHTCLVCGKTDLTDPDMDFRYCPEC